uniref:Elicitin-like protein RAL13J n=1 Tax=Phytophthora ramorum TaxID=164328 RepID=Q2N0C4_PHYRM|nr:elicitin-like protein RAL13J [Phytophthora ramorum]
MKNHRATAVLLLSLVLFFSTTNAAECTDSETTYANSVWAAAAATSACAPYVTQTEPVYVNAPCTATDCVTVVEGVAKNLPDCTYSGINNKIEVQNALTSCNGGDTEDAGTLTTDAPASTTATSEVDSGTSTSSSSSLTPSATASIAPISNSSSSLTPASTASTTSCTTTEVTSISNLFNSTAKSAECTADSNINSSSVDISTSCASYCTDRVSDLAEELPDCYYDYMHTNIKAHVLEEIGGCTISVTANVSTTFYPDSASSTASSQASSGELPPNTTIDSASPVCAKPHLLVISTLLWIVMVYQS